jgi:S1-C subfamily serine protease
VLFPYPHPKALGLVLDPKEKATVLRVEEKSLAEQAGFRKGDVIVRLDGQPLVSIADVQWVLHRAAADGASVKAAVRRGERQAELTLTLPKGWRERDDISWRVSTWGLRVMVTGGMLLETISPKERKKAGLAEKGMALRVKWPGGGNGPHGAALRAGFRQGDVLVSFDGRADLARETDLITYALRARRPGEKVSVSVLRDGKKRDLSLPMQE